MIRLGVKLIRKRKAATNKALYEANKEKKSL
jgi:hypothetical protein